MSPRHVHAIVVDVPDALEDTILGLLAGESLGAQVEPGAAGRRTIRVFVPRAPDRGSLERVLAEAGIEPLAARLSIEGVPDGRWVERYQAGLAPFPIGRRFHVDPRGRGERTPPPGRIALRLVPGRAFGTGEHLTTRLCVAALEDLVRAETSWLDLGCGTAILALVAAHCGARAVRAVDADPEAVAVARGVVRANGLTDRIVVEQATTSDGLGRTWDGVVANLDERTLLASASGISALVAPLGVLVCSGFLEADASRIVGALDVAGLGSCEIRSDGSWALAVARRS